MKAKFHRDLCDLKLLENNFKTSLKLIKNKSKSCATARLTRLFKDLIILINFARPCLSKLTLLALRELQSTKVNFGTGGILI